MDSDTSTAALKACARTHTNTFNAIEHNQVIVKSFSAIRQTHTRAPTVCVPAVFGYDVVDASINGYTRVFFSAAAVAVRPLLLLFMYVFRFNVTKKEERERDD